MLEDHHATPIFVVMSCYFPDRIRADMAIRVRRSLRAFLHCPVEYELHYIIADDGSPYRVGIENLVAGDTTIISGSNKGIGASLNRAIGALPVDALWMYITDDWLLTEEAYLDHGVELLRNRDYDYLRLGPLHPNLVCTTRHHNGMWWLQFDHLNFRGGFYFATRPFLTTKKFWQRVGPFKELVDAYEMERDYSDRVNRLDDIRLGAPANLHGSWEHIGEFNPVGRLTGWENE